MRPRRSPGLRAGSVWTDPGREPGVTGSGLTPGPELTPGAMGADGPAREGGVSGSARHNTPSRYAALPARAPRAMSRPAATAERAVPRHTRRALRRSRDGDRPRTRGAHR